MRLSRKIRDRQADAEPDSQKYRVSVAVRAHALVFRFSGFSFSRLSATAFGSCKMSALSAQKERNSKLPTLDIPQAMSTHPYHSQTN